MRAVSLLHSSIDDLDDLAARCCHTEDFVTTAGSLTHCCCCATSHLLSTYSCAMIDHFVIFSKTGTVLWSKTLCKLSGDPIDTLINRVLLEDRAGEKKFISDAYQMQWAFENKLDLVFVVVYQKILQLLYLEELLEIVKNDFIALFPAQIARKEPVAYDDQFMKLLKATELKFAQKQTRNAPRVRAHAA